jgi:hypothetical protein
VLHRPVELAALTGEVKCCFKSPGIRLIRRWRAAFTLDDARVVIESYVLLTAVPPATLLDARLR